MYNASRGIHYTAPPGPKDEAADDESTTEANADSSTPERAETETTSPVAADD